MTAIVRDIGSLDVVPERLTVLPGDVTDPTRVAEQVAGHDAVISAVGGIREGDDGACAVAARSLVQALRAAKVRRLIVVGAAGTLEVSPGVQRMDAPDFPEVLKGGGGATSGAYTLT